VILRPYRKSDRAACLGVLRSNVPEFFLARDADDVGLFLDKVDALAVRYFVVEDDGGIVACGGVAVDDRKDARMCWGMVRRDLHGKGLGRILLLYRLLEGARMGAKTASLETLPETAGFFEREGFVVTGGKDDHYAPGMHKRDLVLALDASRLAARFEELARGSIEVSPAE
jgi:GNAT superfamily N-acetyltransferase